MHKEMKVFIFCGGFGTRFNNGRPGPLKPLISINNIKILDRIIKIYFNYGFKNFYLLGGYKFQELKKYAQSKKKINVNAINTGLGTPTGGRLKLISKFIKKNESFFLTYGDSLATYNPRKALKLKNKNNFVISSYRYYLPYGVLDINNKYQVKKIYEKNFSVNINAGFYILDYSVFRYIKNYKDSFEINVLPKIIKQKKIIAMSVINWHPIDNHSDKKKIQNILKKEKNIFYEKKK